MALAWRNAQSHLTWVSLVLLMVLGFLVQWQINAGAFDRLESEQVAEDSQRVRIALDSQLRLLTSYGATNSIWDDSHADVRDSRGSLFLEHFPPEEVFEVFGVDGVLGVGPDGEYRVGGLVEGTRFEAPRGELRDPEVLRRLFDPSAPAGQARCGALLVADVPLLYCGFPSYPGDASGKPSGGLVYLDALDTAGLADLGEASDLALTRIPVPSPSAAGARMPGALGDLRVGTRTVDGSHIALMIAVPTADGSGFGVQALRDRPIHRTALGVAGKQLGTITVMGVLLMLAVVRLVRRGVRLQVRPLRETAERVIASGDRGLRVGGDRSGDIGGLAAAIDSMLDAMAAQDEELTRAQVEREARLREAVAQQRSTAEDVRRQAQTIVDETAHTVVEELQDVVQQAAAVRVSVERIESRVLETGSVTRDVVDQVSRTDRVVSDVGDSLQRVEGITRLIATVAEQTKLLALNATIEAARAGEAGQGFRVVANEVKALAAATTRSTGEIVDTVSALERDVQAMASVIGETVRGIGGISAQTEELTGVVQEQRLALQQLDTGVDSALARIDSLSNITRGMEQRQSTRVSVGGTVQLFVRGVPVTARMRDVSDGGLRCLVPGSAGVNLGDAVDVDLAVRVHPGRVRADVRRAVDEEAGRELCLGFVEATEDTRSLVRAFLDQYFSDAPG